MLAERLGCTVAELLERMGSNELTEWMAEEKLRVQERVNAYEEAKKKARQ